MNFCEDIWAYENFSLDDDGHVTGSAHTHEFMGGYTVAIGVFSYEYERDGEKRVNHVPNVVVQHPDGAILREPYARDSEKPWAAVRNARDTAETVYRNAEEYVD